MNIEGQLTVVIGDEFTEIQIEDSNASVRFVTVRIPNLSFLKSLGRQAMLKCDVEVIGLEKVGKTMECKTLEFEIPECDFTTRKSIAWQVVKRMDLDGWIPENYFDSQGSFIDKNGKKYARCTVRRYI